MLRYLQIFFDKTPKLNWKNLSYILSQNLNYIIPKQCIFCSKISENNVCHICENLLLLPNKYHICHVCKQPSKQLVHKYCNNQTFIDGVFIAYKYNPNIERIIEELKYKYNYSIGKDIAKLILDQISIDNIINNNPTLILPVPIHSKKRNLRGFNQTEVIAKNIIEQANNPYLYTSNILKRTRNTKTQVGMKKFEREKNLVNAFDIDTYELKRIRKKIIPKNIIILDDIYTTGTTMEYCAKLIRDKDIFEAEDLRIYGIALARG